MEKTAYGLAIIAAAISATAQGATERRGTNFSPVKGVVVRGLALAYLDGTSDRIGVRYAPLAGGPTRSGPDCAMFLSEPPSLWQVAHGFLWVSDNVSSNFVTDSYRRYVLKDFLDGKRIAGPGAEDGDTDNFVPRDSLLSPLSHARALRMVVDYDYHLSFDFLPTHEDEVLLFELCNVFGADQPPTKPDGSTGNLDVVQLPRKGGDKRYELPHWSFTVIRYKNKWNPEQRQFAGATWERQGEIQVGFQEPFRVLGRGDDYYFVIDSGKLYRAKPDKGADRKMETVWDDEKRPVVAFITDADTDRTFLFCKADKDGKGVYFEMDARPDPHPYDASKVPEAKPDDPLPAVLAYARILLADKKIKDKQ